MQSAKLKYICVKNQKQIALAAQLANSIWPECYGDILSKEQIKYMLQNLQSENAIAAQIAEKDFEYFIIYLDNEPAGYLAVQEENKKLFLSKIYLLFNKRGQGNGKQTLLFAESLAKQKECSSIWLTVNRGNKAAIAAYEKSGYKLLRTQNANIGGGFVMEDFVFEKGV